MLANQRISSQILIKQQLESHYKKLQSVKSTVDNRVPYTMLNNPKYTAKIKQSEKQSARHSRKSNGSERHYNSSPIETYADDPYVDEILRTLLKNAVQRDAMHKPPSISKPRPRTSSVQSDRNISSGSRPRTTQSQRILHRPELSGDLMELKPDLFTPVKDFTPRMLKTSATSRIRTLDCYNPPKKLPGRLRSENTSEKDIPAGKSTEGGSNGCSPSYDTQRSRQNAKKSQETKTARRTSSVVSRSQPSTPLNKPPPTSSPLQVTEKSYELAPKQSFSPFPTRKFLSSPRKSSDMGFRSVSPNRPSHEAMRALSQEIREQNKFELIRIRAKNRTQNIINNRCRLREIQYLDFLSSVTNDILKQGFFDDSHIGSLFRRHLASPAYKIRLDDRLRALEEISQQLNLSKSIYENIEKSSNESISITHGKTVKPSTRSSEGDQFGLAPGPQKSLIHVPPNSLAEPVSSQNIYSADNEATQNILDDDEAITPQEYSRPSAVHDAELRLLQQPRSISNSPATFSKFSNQKEVTADTEVPNISRDFDWMPVKNSTKTNTFTTFTEVTKNLNLDNSSDEEETPILNKENLEDFDYGDISSSTLLQNKSRKYESVPPQRFPKDKEHKSVKKSTEDTPLRGDETSPLYDDKKSQSPALRISSGQDESSPLQKSAHEPITAFTEVSSIEYTHTDYPYSAALQNRHIETTQVEDYEDDFCESEFDGDDAYDDEDENGEVISYK